MKTFKQFNEAKKKDKGASEKKEKEFHKELDDLVHDTFGKREDEKECED